MMTEDEDPIPETAMAEEPLPQDPLIALEQERDQLKALAQRTQADFVNYKRRTDEERLVISRMATGQVLARLLPVLDDLQRAVDAIPENAPASWGDGVRMVASNLQAIMQAEGVAIYEPEPGDTFDPVEHEAVYFQPTDEQPAGAVLSVVRPGYRTSDRVLRTAQVVVARGTTAEELDENGATNN